MSSPPSCVSRFLRSSFGSAHSRYPQHDLVYYQDGKLVTYGSPDVEIGVGCCVQTPLSFWSAFSSFSPPSNCKEGKGRLTKLSVVVRVDGEVEDDPVGRSEGGEGDDASANRGGKEETTRTDQPHQHIPPSMHGTRKSKGGWEVVVVLSLCCERREPNRRCVVSRKRGRRERDSQ